LTVPPGAFSATERKIAIDFDAVFGAAQKLYLTPKQADAFHELRRLMKSTSKGVRPCNLRCVLRVDLPRNLKRRRVGGIDLVLNVYVKR